MSLNDELTRFLKVYLVDDHPIFRLGVVSLLESSLSIRVCGEAEDVDSAMAGIFGGDVDFVIVDLALRGGNGLQLINLIRRAGSALPILVVSMHSDSVHALKSIQAGANGFLTKGENPARILAAIEQIMQGKIVLDERFSESLISRVVSCRNSPDGGDTFQITPRELEILNLIGKGCSSVRIAEALVISKKTVDVHKANLKKKLRLANASELQRFAMHWVEFGE